MSSVALAPRLGHILIVDDDAGLRTEMAVYLVSQGFQVDEAENASDMNRMLARARYDLVVLDVMMPGEDGLSVCRRLADSGGPPVVMLSAMSGEVDRIVGLELGADDYLGKPCNPRELLARIRAVLRRRESRAIGSVMDQDQDAFVFEGFRLELTRRRLKAPTGVVVLLTAGEFSLLCVFLEQPNRVLSREVLLELARGAETEVFDRAIDVQVSRLRRKLHACTDRELIVTSRGMGYMFSATVSRR